MPSYSDVEEQLGLLVAAATPDAKRALAEHAVRELTSRPGLGAAIGSDFDERAAALLREVVADPVSVDAATLVSQLARIDAGDLSDGDMDTEAIWALTGLEAWRDFQSGDVDASVEVLARTLLEVSDFEVGGARLDDFLAEPLLSDTFEAIASRLRGQAT